MVERGYLNTGFILIRVFSGATHITDIKGPLEKLSTLEVHLRSVNYLFIKETY